MVKSLSVFSVSLGVFGALKASLRDDGCNVTMTVSFFIAFFWLFVLLLPFFLPLFVVVTLVRKRRIRNTDYVTIRLIGGKDSGV